MPSRSTCIKILLIYALYTNSQGKCPLYFMKFILTEKWVCCKQFKSFIFEVFVDKRGQVAGDSMTHSRRSSGGGRLLMKALPVADANALLEFHLDADRYNFFSKVNLDNSFIWLHLSCVFFQKFCLFPLYKNRLQE